MTYKTVLAALLAGAMSIAAGSACAQGPLSIDFTKMEASTKKAIEAGNDNAAQTPAAEEALKEAKATLKQLTSPSVQKIASHLKMAVAASKEGKTAEAGEHLKAALSEMKQPVQ